MKQKSNQIIQFAIILFGLITLNGCNVTKGGGAIAAYMDEYYSTTEERRFKLTEEVEGFIIKYQKAYDCNDDSYKGNATAIISYDSGFITIYDYCQQTAFKKGDKVIVKPVDEVNPAWAIREIYEPIPKSSENYGYWYCVSCRYNNAFGTIELMNDWNQTN